MPAEERSPDRREASRCKYFFDRRFVAETIQDGNTRDVLRRDRDDEKRGTERDGSQRGTAVSVSAFAVLTDIVFAPCCPTAHSLRRASMGASRAAREAG